MSDDNNKIDPLFKLKNSPLQGDEAYRSPFYRRLLSAGYKGYLQGSIGGATLFAGLGLLAGGVVAFGAWSAGIAAGSAFLAVPILAGAGLIYGKDTFGHIGAFAAISAEQAELSEKRRSLLDRYYETPSADEAKEIEKSLMTQAEEKLPAKWFHWKTGLLGAVLVGSLAILAAGAIPVAVATEGVATAGAISGAVEAGGVIAKILSAFSLSETSSIAYIIAGSIGALVGAVAGVDRTYIRKWFDIQELWHEDRQVNEYKKEHTRTVDRLSQAFAKEGFVKESRDSINALKVNDENKVEPISPNALQPIRNKEESKNGRNAPSSQIAQISHENRLESAEMKYLTSL